MARTLRAMWAYRQAIAFTPYGATPEDCKRQETNLFGIINRIESGGGTPAIDAVVAFTHDETLEELVQAIRRDAEADKPQAALDRLHTYSMKKFAHLLRLHGAPTSQEEPLHSRVGRYIKLLEAERELKPITKQILKNCIGIFQSYNDVRNSHSFAHDNTVIEKEEARFIFETVVSMLRFVRSVEAAKFEAAS
ncbi:abortive infection family protein [Bradyrhizobium sp. CCBAU 25338]|uniref:abortive infection family protein n=1 Tax=Bradyrhizobium sp. CCBAU 25338 TaxID=1641877 RepID=UPI002304BBAC|nr:abortive infection family protein [Bradyrhizobium sp. CCBAU 25338]